MPISFLPKVVARDITQLTGEFLQGRGVKLLMMDFDNTIVPYTTSVPEDEVLAWLRQMQASGIILCVVSNSKKERVPAFCRKYHIDCVTHAKKPFSRGIGECLKRYGIAPEECALVGDQIFTDVLGANGCGVQSILVKSINNHNFWLKARHVLEMPFIYLAKKRRI